MPNLETIEKFKIALEKLGNEELILSEQGEMMREITPPDPSLDDDLSELLGEVSAEMAGIPERSSESIKDSLEGEGELETPEIDLSIPNSDNLFGSGINDIDSFLSNDNSFLDNIEKDNSPEQPQQPKEPEEPEDDFSAALEDLLNTNEGNDFEKADVNPTNFDSNTNLKVDSGNSVDSSVSNGQEKEVSTDDLFDELMASVEDSIVEDEYGEEAKGDLDFFQLDEFKTEESPEKSPEESPEKNSQEVEKDSNDNFFSMSGVNDGDGSFDSFIDADINEFELTEKELPESSSFNTPLVSTGEIKQKSFTLSNEELNEIKKNLTFLPRNLKILVEEYISDDETEEKNVSNITEMLLNNESARRIADFIEKETGSQVQLPNKYKALSGYNIEAKQNSFMYKLLSQYIPLFLKGLAITSAIVAIIIATFWIIAPWAATQKKYSEGRAFIQTQEWKKAESCFNTAYYGSPTKKWPYPGMKNKNQLFKYAKLYREKRQFNYAENKYKQLINDFRAKPKVMKQGKLAYATMLAQDLSRYEEAITQLTEIKMGDNKKIDNKLFSGIGNDLDTDLQLARTWFLYGEDANNLNYYEKAKEALIAYSKAKGKKDYFTLESYQYWYLAKMGQNQKLKRMVETQLLEKKKIKRFKKAKKDPLIYNDIIKNFLEQKQTDQTVTRLLAILEKDFPYNPELQWHHSKLYRLSIHPALEKSSLIKTLNLLKRKNWHSKREHRIQILSNNRIGEINYSNQEVNKAKNSFLTAIQNYENMLDRKVLKPKSEFGKIYSNLGNIFYYYAGNYDAAYIQYNLAEQNSYHSYKMNYKQGFIDYWREDYSKAKLKFDSVITVVPGNKNVIFAQGNAMLYSMNLSDAQARYIQYIQKQSEILPGFADNLNPQKKEQASVIKGLESAYNNLGITYYRQFERSQETKKKLLSEEMLRKSLEYYNLLNRKNSIRAGASNEGLKNHSIPTPNSIASLNQHEIWYHEPTPKLQSSPDIPFDLESLEMVATIETNPKVWSQSKRSR